MPLPVQLSIYSRSRRHDILARGSKVGDVSIAEQAYLQAEVGKQGGKRRGTDAIAG